MSCPNCAIFLMEDLVLVPRCIFATWVIMKEFSYQSNYCVALMQSTLLKPYFAGASIWAYLVMCNYKFCMMTQCDRLLIFNSYGERLFAGFGGGMLNGQLTDKLVALLGLVAEADISRCAEGFNGCSPIQIESMTTFGFLHGGSYTCIGPAGSFGVYYYIVKISGSWSMAMLATSLGQQCVHHWVAWLLGCLLIGLIPSKFRCWRYYSRLDLNPANSFYCSRHIKIYLFCVLIINCLMARANSVGRSSSLVSPRPCASPTVISSWRWCGIEP